MEFPITDLLDYESSAAWITKHFHPTGFKCPECEALVVAYPKDVTMYQDAVKTTGNESRLQVKDLIELIYEAM